MDASIESDSNRQIAQRLRDAAEILAAQGANPFRVGAYRKAADSIESHPGSIAVLFATRGAAGLDELPGVGPGIAAAIAEMLKTGRWSQLERLRGSLDPIHLFATVPGVGPELARRMHDALGIDTLEALEHSAHEGRLAHVPGIGPRRVTAIRAALADMLGRYRPRTLAGAGAKEVPPVAVLLDVDHEYRARADADELPKIAPRRFNPEARAWLPVLHTTRDKWHFTALYSNTAKAHELGRTHDWVVLYFDDNHHAERQCTVVTEPRGALAGRRVVRGREEECRVHYGDRVSDREGAAETGRS